MEGLDAQDIILDEQDLSNANIDDLLAAMKAEESSAGFLREDVGTATDVGSAGVIDDATMDVINAMADAAPDAQDIISADEAMTEALESIAVIDGILQSCIRDIEPDLQQVHAEHNLYPARRTAPFPGGIIRLNLLDPFIPWNDLVHQAEKLLLLCYFLPSTVFHVAEGHLIHALNPLKLLALWHFYYTTNGLNYYWKCRFNQRFPNRSF